ncbi:MOSC domain-containing protein [Candidatus Margulisiibacteriota bacterium]
MPKVKAVCVSKVKGQKSEVKELVLVKDLGAEGDFHAKGGERQVSLLANAKLAPGAYGENIVTEGIDLLSLSIGQKLKIGEAGLEISKIGKECKERCQIYYQTGDCIMPREGVFAKVIKGGIIKPGDEIKI